MAITLGITLLMVGISAANYRKAILVPGIRKLSGLTVKTEEYVPFLNYFLQLFHTEDFQKARASHEAGDPEKDRFLDWMDAAPSFTADDPEFGRESLFFDIIAFDILLRETMEQVDLERTGKSIGQRWRRTRMNTATGRRTSAGRRVFTVWTRRTSSTPR